MEHELIFRASRKKAAFLLLLSICLVVLGIFVTTEKPILGWLSIGFFGLGIPASIFMMLTNSSYLKLDHEGFEIVAMSRKFKAKWTEVEVFETGEIYGNKVISIVYSHQYNKQQTGRAIASALSGMEGAIADHYVVPIEEICRTMNTWKERFG